MKKIPGISAVFGGARVLWEEFNFFGGMFGDKKSPVTAADSKSNVGGGSGEEAPKSNTGHKGGARASTGRGGPIGSGFKSAMSGISALNVRCHGKPCYRIYHSNNMSPH